MMKDVLTHEVVEEIRSLPRSQLRAVQAYVYLLKLSGKTDPSELYFWTTRWQAWEAEAQRDKRAGRVVGDGTLKGLLSALKRR
jgi:hypothetical protein